MPATESPPVRVRPRKPLSLRARFVMLASLLVLLAGGYWFVRDVLTTRFIRGIAQDLLNNLGGFSAEKIGAVEVDLQGDVILHDCEVYTNHRGARRLFYRAGRIVLSLDGIPGRDKELHVMRVDLFHPEIFIRREADGEWNVSWAFKRLPRPDRPPPKPSPWAAYQPVDESFPPNGVHIYDGTIHVTLVTRNGTETTWTLSAVQAVLSKEKGVIAVRPFTADFYGGRFVGDIEAPSTEPLAVDLQLRVTDADVTRMAERLRLKRRVTGRFDAVLSLTSSREKTGQKPIAAGHAIITDGDLWELPTFSRVLALLALEPGQERKIDTAELQFLVQEDRFLITQMDFLGSPVCLFGDGQMDLDGENLEIVFIPRLGKKSLGDIIPIAGIFIQFLLDIAKGALLPVVVSGSFTNPEISVKPGYIIAGPIRKLIEKKSPGPIK